MIKRMNVLSLVFLTVMLANLVGNLAVAEIFHYGIDDGFKYTSHVKKHVYIVDYIGKKKKVTIPTEVDGLKVKMMENFGDIEKLHIPEGVEVINISSARKLKKISVDSKHEKYTVKNNLLLNKKKTVLIASLKNNTNLQIPKTVKRISRRAFSKTNIIEFVIPAQITKLDSSIFADCQKLRLVTIHKKITSLPGSLFAGCKNLKKVSLHNNLTSIGAGAFSNCTSLKEINIPDSVKKIGSNAFTGCKSLKNVVIPNTVTKLGAGAFNECSDLKKVKLSNKLTKLTGYEIFSGCKVLKELHIPESVSLIGHNTLVNNSLKRVYIYNKKCKIKFLFKNKILSYEAPAIDESISIYGYKGSTAQKYAKKNGNKFVALN